MRNCILRFHLPLTDLSPSSTALSGQLLNRDSESGKFGPVMAFHSQDNWGQGKLSSFVMVTGVAQSQLAVLCRNKAGTWLTPPPKTNLRGKQFWWFQARKEHTGGKRNASSLGWLMHQPWLPCSRMLPLSAVQPQMPFMVKRRESRASP